MATYTIKGWYDSNGAPVDVKKTITADDDEAAREDAGNMFDQLNDGGRHTYTILDQHGKLMAVGTR